MENKEEFKAPIVGEPEEDSVIKVIEFKVLSAGTLDYQAKAKAKAIADMEATLNAPNVLEVMSVKNTENENEFSYTAVVKLAAPKKIGGK